MNGRQHFRVSLAKVGMFLALGLVFSALWPSAAFSQSLFNRRPSSGASPLSSEVDTRLIADTTAIEPGVPFRLGVQFTIQPEWHIYWRYAGEVGIPTQIEWMLPEGFTIGELQWPNPHAIDDPATGLKSYGWDDELVLFAWVTPPDALDPSGEFVFGAKSSWLACLVQCVPGSAEDSLTLPVGMAAASDDAELLDRYATFVPRPTGDAGVPLEITLQPETIQVAPGEPASVEIEISATAPWRLLPMDSGQEVQFFPDITPDFTTSHPVVEKGRGETSIAGVGPVYESLSVRWTFEVYDDASPETVTLRPTLTLALVDPASGEIRTVRTALETDVTISGPADVAAAGGAPGETPLASDANASATAEDGAGDSASGFSFAVERQEAERSLLLVMLFALVGGMLLNVMPCVLPVLSLKVLGFVNQARENPRRVLRSGLVFALGVYASFLVLALFVIGVKAAGAQIGWGFQLQEPRFVILISAAIFAFGLSLFGVFSIELPGMAASNLQGATARGGHGGDFMNGVLATVLATPCTAPLLGPALGFAFSQPAAMILVFFGLIATGLALPYVLLAARPGWLKFVPKPGPWMNHFKHLMGVLLMGTVVWLLSVLGSQAGADAIVAGGWFLLFVGVACGVIGWGFDLGASSTRRRGAIGVAVAISAFGYFSFPERQLQALAVAGGMPPSEAVSTVEAAEREGDGIVWKPFSVEAVNALVAQNKTVFVDFTADWCLTCKVNERTVLSTDRVIEAFRQYEVEALVADYTRRQPEITKILNDFGRAGVPMYLIFPAGRPEEFILLPEILTPSLVIEKLAEASRPAALADAG